mgnify:CR=1 FL=1
MSKELILSPIMNASGCYCRTKTQMDALVMAGMKTIITKTCTLLPNNGNMYPTFIEIDNDTSINCLGMPNMGYSYYKDLYLKKGKYGLYVEWDTNKVSINAEFGHKPIETITYVDVFKYLEKDKLLNPNVPIGMVRELNSHLSIRTGKFGDYIFYKTKRLKKPQFYKLNGFDQDYKKCNKDILLNWIKMTHNVE